MSLEDDAEHLSDAMARAIKSTTAGNPDPLVFVFRGSEIAKLMLERADEIEQQAAQRLKDGAERDETEKMALQMAASFRPMPDLALPPPVSSHHLDLAQREASSLRKIAKTFRMLSAHVEEDRIFRLHSSDLAFFLGLQAAYLP